eukprot:snap_masked-scaffold_59-processed-gene-0.73-mRNA-1 protein AED:1.00 eAED:1.00 QI:0/-1/0/0/-1/1/1/0/219
METQVSAPTKEELDLQERNQSERNDSWISYRGSTPEEMLEVVNKVSANRFRVKKMSSHNFSEEETKRIFGFSKNFLRRCKLKCVSSKNCTFELNFKFDLKLGKYIFQVKCLDHRGHEVEVKKNERKFLSDLKPPKVRMLKYLGVAETPLTSVEVALHREFSGIYFNKELLKRQLKKAREEVNHSEDTNIQILIKIDEKCLSNSGIFEITTQMIQKEDLG